MKYLKFLIIIILNIVHLIHHQICGNIIKQRGFTN